MNNEQIVHAIQQDFQSMVTCLETLAATVRQQAGHFQELSENWVLPETKQKPAVEHPIPIQLQQETQTEKPTEIVRLNVGGCSFATTLTTLRKEKDSMLCLMTQNDNWQPDFGDDQYFIDRSSTHFNLILDYLRSDDPASVVSSWTAEERQFLQAEADFFQLGSLQHLLACNIPTNTGTPLLTWDSSLLVYAQQKTSACISFSHHNTVLHMSAGSGEESKTPWVWARPPPKGVRLTHFSFIISNVMGRKVEYCIGYAGTQPVCTREAGAWGSEHRIDFEIDTNTNMLNIKATHKAVETVALNEPVCDAYPFNVLLPSLKFRGTESCMVTLIGR
eukprot:TRINITY_DN624_c0_g1_i1.p1 TRINITY_DN624_c0_g1~~TRINITY_DN624_c0_g1_i1.p1  ORF type:complete len:333 (+),score=20.75 TRINITY_DN624_c0_g1_i1:39-1037(+)